MKRRFAKFGIVGMSGIGINLGTLYVCKNFVFNNIHAEILSFDIGLNLSLGAALFCSLLSNFILNRNWTWRDRKKTGIRDYKYELRLFSKYAAASAVGMGIQIIIYNTLIKFGINYLASSLAGIGVGAISNFTLNHKFTFKAKK